jgi:beta-glucosidase
MTMRTTAAAVFAALLCAAVCPFLLAQQAADEAAYKDASLPIEQRVNDLVSRMSLEEKVSQMGHPADAKFG